MIQQILHGHTSPATAYKVDNYPYGYTLRTTIFYWIESKKGKGDRFCSMTVNPKTGRLNAPKYSTYSVFEFLYLNEDGHVKSGALNCFDPAKFVQQFKNVATQYGNNFNEVQVYNLRSNYAAALHASAAYWIVKYSPEARPAFKSWLADSLTHILKCDSIMNLTDIPTPPAEDNPEGEVKMVTTHSFVIGGTDPRYSGGKPVTEDYGGYKGHEAY